MTSTFDTCFNPELCGNAVNKKATPVVNANHLENVSCETAYGICWKR